MAISSYQVFLMKWNNSESEIETRPGKISYWRKFCDIKDFPKLGGSPEAIQTTTFSDEMHTYIPGIQDSEALEFTANYDASTYSTTITSNSGKSKWYAVVFGADSNGDPSGQYGIFYFKGVLNAYVDAGSVNEVVNMKLTITPSTIIRKAEAE